MADYKPKVSILVPIYNVERYVRQCLDSILAQTFTNIEVICINDGSTDGSRDIIEEFLPDPRFRVIDKSNSGYGASMNRGLEAARGEYIAILESDDYLEAQALEKLYSCAVEHNAEVVKANFYFYWSKPFERDELCELITPSMAGRVVNPQDEPDIFYLKPSIWSALYKRSFLICNDIDFLETPGASYQDASFNFKVWACATRVVYLQDAFLHYRQDNEASSVNSPGKVYCVCDEYEEMDRFLDADLEKKDRLKTVEIKMKYDSYMWNYERLSSDFQVEFLNRMAEEFREHVDEGAVDLGLFEPWKVIDLRTILDSPELYHAQRLSCRKAGRLGKAIHYLRVGGVPMAVKIAKRKYFSKR